MTSRASATETSTYLRVNNTSPDGNADTQYRFTVASPSIIATTMSPVFAVGVFFTNT